MWERSGRGRGMGRRRGTGFVRRAVDGRRRVVRRRGAVRGRGAGHGTRHSISWQSCLPLYSMPISTPDSDFKKPPDSAQ